jgi:hypothetical protein
MIRINVALEIKYRSSNIVLVRAALIAGVVAAVGYYCPIYFAELKDTEAQAIRASVEEKKAQLEKLKLDVKEVNNLQKRLGELKSRAARIRGLSAMRKQPVFFLDTLQQQHLERMWIANIAVADNAVTMKAYALDHAVIAEYVRRLKLLGMGADGADAGDLKDFVPPFMRAGGDLKTEVAQIETIAPIKLSDVKLIKSVSETQDNTLVQSFQLTFNTNLK